MPLTVFDAVGKFSADTSDLDQFIVKLEQGLSNASEKAAASTQALKAAQDEFRTSIRAVSAEGGDTTENLERLAQAERNLALASAAAKAEHAALKAELIGTKEASTIASEATAELAGKLGSMFGLIAATEGFKMLIEHTQESVLQLELLSQKTGIAIETLAGIQHVAEGTGVRFEEVATSLTRLSRAQAIAIEGGQAQVQAFHRLGISAEELKTLSPEQLFYRIAGAMANAKNHAEENASAFALLGRGGAALIPIFNQGSEALRAQIEEASKASGVNKEAGAAALDWERQTANLSEAFRSGLIPVMELAVPIIKSVETAGSGVAMVIGDLAAVLGGLFYTAVADFKGMGTIIDDVIHGNFSRLVSDAKNIAGEVSMNLDGIGKTFEHNWDESSHSIKNIWADVKPLQGAKDDLSDLTDKTKLKDLTAVLKAELDQQLADIEKFKSDMHAAYAAGQIDAAAWAVAQLRAADAAGIAHEHYLERLIAVYTKAGEAEKAHAAQIELSATRTKDESKETNSLAEAMEKHRAATQRVREEYYRLIETNVDKDFAATQRAAEQLTRAEEELAKAQTKLSEDKLSQHFKDQESAITKLAEMHLITEKQKDDRLKLLEQQQSNAAIAILEQQLAKEKAVMEAAQAKVTQAQANPFFTPAQVLELEVNLKKAETAVTNTEAQIVQTQEKFNKQSEQNDKSHYGRSLLLAMSYGNELLAEQLKQNHASLLAAQAELAAAKARGQDTTVIQQQINILKQNQSALEKEANGHKINTGEIQKETAALLQSLKAQLSVYQQRGLDTKAIEQEIKYIEQLQNQNTKETNYEKLALTQKVLNTQQALLFAQALLAEQKAHGQNTTAIEKEIADLQKLLTLMKQLPAAAQQDAQSINSLAMSAQQMEQQLGQAVAQMVAKVMSGQQSLGQATKQMVSQLALQWGEFYVAKGIADMFTDPGAGAVELAEGLALMALGTALGSGSSSSGGGAGAGAPVAGQGGGNVQLGGGNGNNQNQGITHLAGGGVVTHQIMVGDSESGGDADEAVIPLENDSALNAITGALLPGLARALAAPANQDRTFPSIPTSLLSPSTMSAASSAMEPRFTSAAPDSSQSSSDLDDRMDKFAQNLESRLSQASREGDTHINMPNLKGILGAGEVKKFLRQVNTLVGNRRATLNSSNSLRVTRRSQ